METVTFTFSCFLQPVVNCRMLIEMKRLSKVHSPEQPESGPQHLANSLRSFYVISCWLDVSSEQHVILTPPPPLTFHKSSFLPNNQITAISYFVYVMIVARYLSAEHEWRRVCWWGVRFLPVSWKNHKNKAPQPVNFWTPLIFGTFPSTR